MGRCVRQLLRHLSAADTEAALAGGEDVVLVIDVQGARQVRSRGHRDRRHLRAAAIARRFSSSGCAAAARTATNRSERRLEVARREVDEFAQYEYLVVNDEVETAVERLRAIVVAERARVTARCGPNAEVIIRDIST